MPEMKERIINTTGETKQEIQIQDLTPPVENPLPREVKDWMQKVETMQQSVADDVGQPLLTPAPSQNPVVTLPTTRKTFTAGFKKTVSEAGRWLSVFILKMIKKHEGQVKFKDE